MNGFRTIESLSFQFPPNLEIDHASSFFALDDSNALDDTNSILLAVIAIKNSLQGGTARNPQISMDLENIGSTVIRNTPDIPRGESRLLYFGITINSNAITSDGTLNAAFLNNAGLLEGFVRIRHNTGNPIIPVKLANELSAQDVITIPFLTVCIADAANPPNLPRKKLKKGITLELTDGNGTTITRQIEARLFANFDDPQIDLIGFRFIGSGALPASQPQNHSIQRRTRKKHFCVLADPGVGSTEELDVTNARITS